MKKQRGREREEQAAGEGKGASNSAAEDHALQGTLIWRGLPSLFLPLPPQASIRHGTI